MILSFPLEEYNKKGPKMLSSDSSTRIPLYTRAQANTQGPRANNRWEDNETAI